MKRARGCNPEATTPTQEGPWLLARRFSRQDAEDWRTPGLQWGVLDAGRVDAGVGFGGEHGAVRKLLPEIPNPSA